MNEADIELIERARLWASMSPSQLRKAELLRLLELAGGGAGFAAYDAIKNEPADPVLMTSLNQLLDMIDGVPPNAIWAENGAEAINKERQWVFKRPFVGGVRF